MNLSMPRFFKNLPKKTELAALRKQWAEKLDQPTSEPSIQAPGESTTSVLEVCDSDVAHPIAGPGEHHYHDTLHFGKICCKCGMDYSTGHQISSGDLAEVRKEYW